MRSFNRAYRKMSEEEQGRYSLRKISLWGYIITSIMCGACLVLVVAEKFTKTDLSPYIIAFVLVSLIPLWYIEASKDFLDRFCKK